MQIEPNDTNLMKEEQVSPISLTKTYQRDSDNEPEVDSHQCTVQLIQNMLHYQKKYYQGL